MKTWDIGYQKAKRRAKRIYSKLGRIACPAFGNELVAFASEGFNHLIRKGRIPRTRNEQKRRFVLVPHIEKIIKNPKATILYERRDTRYITDRHGVKTKVQSTADFWTFVQTINHCNVKIVVRQLGTGGPKHFLSVVGENVKIRRGRRLKTEKPTM